ncbi:MAG: aspartate aminotransferase family protein [Acidobacteria bacterium]|nr:MAG: aspartate aminotransferase family protein [Acidobacteriota bacterium]
MNDQTRELLRRALTVIPEATQTLSKGPSQFVQGPSPVFIERGRGSRVYDSEGTEYIDWPMALGPVLLGHCDPRVNQAIRDQLELGITFTLPSPLETSVAEQLVATVPSAEMVRFAKSGSEAVAGAIRLARAVTGRDLILTSGYHGWHDAFASHTGRSAGVPSVTAALSIEFTETEVLKTLLDDRGAAAVIIEPATGRAPAPGYLEEVARLTREAGALLIFDEIITGFRWAPGGAQEYYGVAPDITVVGKALGNGMPISAICGSATIMEHFSEIFVSGTHGGECLSLAAAGAVLRAVNETDVIEKIWATGRRVGDGIGKLIAGHDLDSHFECAGEPPRVVVTVIGGDLAVRSLLQQELAKARILFNGSLFPTPAHSKTDVDQTLDAFDKAFRAVARGIASGDPASLVEGELIAPAFRQA